MRAAIMQPYFLPYVGYFQLMASVDVFVVYDDIKYTKSGWINRNRILLEGREATISLPIVRDSDALDISERRISPAFDKAGLIRRLEAAYFRSTAFDAGMSLVQRIVSFPDDNLFSFINNSIHAIRDHFSLKTQLVVSSSLGVDRSLKGQSRVIETCRRLGVSSYLNPVGGAFLYSEEDFVENGLSLEFITPRISPYPQTTPEFFPSLSILDLIMNVPIPVANFWLHGTEISGSKDNQEL